MCNLVAMRMNLEGPGTFKKAVFNAQQTATEFEAIRGGTCSVGLIDRRICSGHYTRSARTRAGASASATSTVDVHAGVKLPVAVSLYCHCSSDGSWKCA